MFGFSLKLTIFLLPLLALLGIVEYKARAIPSNFAVKRERFEQNVERAEIIVAGSSHSYYGINPGLLGRPATSIAYPGQDLYYDTRILLKYLPQAKRARLVVLPLTYVSFESTIEDTDWQAQTNYYYKFWGIPEEFPTFRLAHYSATILFGLQRSRDFFLNGKIEEGDKIDEFGGNANDRKTDLNAVLNARLALKRHNAVMRAGHIAQNVKYLDELFDALEARGIKAVIITTPCFGSYYENLDPV